MAVTQIPDWFRDDHHENEIESRALDIGYERALREIDALSVNIANGWGEREVQGYLLDRPYLLLGRQRTGHGTYAFGEAALGGQYRIDWAVASGSSGGLSWELIELETPRKLPFKVNGHLSEAARGGVEQIKSWRIWLQKNADYAQRPKTRSGLGYHDSCFNHGIVVVGRRLQYEAAKGRAHYNDMRRAMKTESHIELMSYETFLESLRFRFSK